MLQKGSTLFKRLCGLWIGRKSKNPNCTSVIGVCVIKPVVSAVSSSKRSFVCLFVFEVVGMEPRILKDYLHPTPPHLTPSPSNTCLLIFQLEIKAYVYLEACLYLGLVQEIEIDLVYPLSFHFSFYGLGCSTTADSPWKGALFSSPRHWCYPSPVCLFICSLSAIREWYAISRLKSSPGTSFLHRWGYNAIWDMCFWATQTQVFLFVPVGIYVTLGRLCPIGALCPY